MIKNLKGDVEGLVNRIGFMKLLKASTAVMVCCFLLGTAVGLISKG